MTGEGRIEKQAADLKVGDAVYMNGNHYPVLGVRVIRCHGEGYEHLNWVSVRIECIDGQTASYFFQADEIMEVGGPNEAN